QAGLQAAPPPQDVFPDIGATNAVTANINPPAQACNNTYEPDVCPFVAYITENKTSSSQTVTYKRDWSISAGISGEYGVIESSLTTTYGHNFEKTTQAIQTQTTLAGPQTRDDDPALYNPTHYPIPHYPPP